MSGAITPEFLHQVEDNMSTIAENEYAKLASDTWWQIVAKERQSVAKRDRLIWLIETAKIKRLEPGSMQFEDLVSQVVEYESEFAGIGMKLRKEQLEDVYNGTPGGEGLELAGAWARQVAAQAAYWPQDQVAAAIRAGAEATSLAYDGRPFFDASHRVNGINTDDGTFSNLITSRPIDASVTLDVALDNLQAVFAAMAAIPMPNGTQPRKLRPAAILVPPALMARAQQLTNAKLLAQAASSGGGGADVEAVIRNWGIGQPVQCDELAAAFGGSDTTYYIVAREAGSSQLGALVYVNREPFNIHFHGPMTDAELARMREFQWLTGGRNVVGYGHPYALFRVTAA